MSTYAIGDVQGCLSALEKLLNKIQYNPAQDQLWFAGDLVNRGPHSLQTLRFITALEPEPICVLGNHDLALLAAAHTPTTLFDPTDHFVEILNAPDCTALLYWLRHRPLLHHDPALGFTLTHAGIFPKWDLCQAKARAHEVELTLQGPHYRAFFDHMYGNEPHYWQETLSGWERLRFITNAFTRMRFCTASGGLNLTAKGTPAQHPSDTPWFAMPDRPLADENLLFGHWAALQGRCAISHVYPLDTGCVWGYCLTAFCLETHIKTEVECKFLLNR